MLCQTFRCFALLALCGTMSLPMAHAQDEEKTDGKSGKESATTKTFTIRVASGKHWIGVMAVPIDDSLKAQLGLKDRLIVHHVLPETPAGKAGLQAHDILLKYGDKEIANLKDLVSAVAEGKDNETKLVVLRGGKEVALSITPGERPDEDRLHELLPKEQPEAVRRLLNQAIESEGGDKFTWHGFGPAVMSKTLKMNTEFPAGLSVTVNKENEKPAVIIAKKDGKTYETTADKLDILPEEIRSHVSRLLHGPQVIALGAGAGADGKGMEGAIRLRLNMEQLKDLHKAAEGEHKQIEVKVRQAEGDAAKAIRQHVEIRKVETDAVGHLRKEVEALRKAVEELQGAKKNDSDKE